MSDVLRMMDASAWVGQYPFRGIDKSSPDDLRTKMHELGITRALVSPLEGVFWENNLDAYRQWVQRLSGQPEFEVWPVVNPSMPGQIDEFRRLIDESPMPPRGFRLTPNYHGYRVESPCLADLMTFARQRDLAVQLFVRIADERWHWMLKMPGVSDDDVFYFTSLFAGMRLMICGHGNINRLASRLRQQHGLYVDISRVRSPVSAVEQLLQQVPPAQVVFGSLWPIQIVEATLWQVQEARIDESIRAGVLGGNLKKFLEERRS